MVPRSRRLPHRRPPPRQLRPPSPRPRSRSSRPNRRRRTSKRPCAASASPSGPCPSLGLLPLWIILYAGSLSPAATGGPTELTLGATIFATKCSSCHGASGGGGVGRQLSGGEVLKTFPNIADQLAFVSHGSEGAGIGTVYGDPNREGGPHIAGSYNGNHMPAFEKALKPEELLAVVRHERETISGEELTTGRDGPGRHSPLAERQPDLREGLDGARGAGRHHPLRPRHRQPAQPGLRGFGRCDRLAGGPGPTRRCAS